MNITEFASLGGKARARSLTKQRRIEIARNAGLASAKQRASKSAANQGSNNKIDENKL